MRRGLALALAGVLVFEVVPSVGAAPASKPAARDTARPRAASYSGQWRLDLARSDMGKRLPKSREDLITEQGPWLSVRSVSIRSAGDTLQLDYRYRTDGESVNNLRGQDIRTRGRREGGALRFDSEAQFAVFKLEVNERWVLSADGATLTQERTSRSPLGAEKQRLVFRRAH